MRRPWHAISFLIYAGSLLAIAALALLGATASAQVVTGQGVPIRTEQAPIEQTISRQALDGFGRDAYELITMQPGVGVTKWEDHTADGTLREDGIIQYSTTPGASAEKAKETRDYFGDTGKLEYRTVIDWNPSGAVLDYRYTSYDFRGYRIGDHITDYNLNGRTQRDWSLRNDYWRSTTIPYLSTTPGPARAPAAPVAPPANKSGVSCTPQIETAGLLLPRDYQPGEFVTGSLWKSNYAEAFKLVPGLTEYSFPMQTYNLPDGTPDYAGIEIGVKDYGFLPVQSNGSFSLFVPNDWKGSLDLQARQPDAISTMGASYADFHLDAPAAAPAMPSNLVVPGAKDFFTKLAVAHLIDLWNEAFDLETEWDIADNNGATDEVMEEIESDLRDVYGDIDDVTEVLPNDLVVKLARQLASETRTINHDIREAAGDNLTGDEKDELQEYDAWASFLDNEAAEFSGQTLFETIGNLSPCWTNPVLTADKLGAVRGFFPGNSDGIGLTIGDHWIQPLGATPDAIYFMPPINLTAGLNNLVIDSPGMPTTSLPVFYMTLTMWADATNLLKGQSTTYHVKLTGLNGLPSSAWGSSFFPGDLVSPSEVQGGSSDSSRTGTITLSVTNGSPGVIAMQNVFTTLNAQSFAPSGSFQLDGGLGAIVAGGFSINGVARAFLTPESGWGGAAPNGSPPLPGQTIPDPLANWYGSSSSVSAPVSTLGLPQCDSSNGCLDPEELKIYNEATGQPNSATIDNRPAPPTREEAQKRADDAQKAWKDWTDREKAASAKVQNAWDAAVHKVNQGLRDDFSSARDERVRTETAEALASGKFTRDPTPENKQNSEFAQAQKARAVADLQAAKDAIINEFTPADRAAYEDARGELQRAAHYRAEASQEARDADQALAKIKPVS